MPDVIQCPNCGTENAAGQQFCGSCGNPLEEGPQATVLREERRWATVVFADLSGFTRASEKDRPHLGGRVSDAKLRSAAASPERGLLQKPGPLDAR